MPPTRADSFTRLRRYTWVSQCGTPVVLFAAMAVVIAQQPRPWELTLFLLVTIVLTSFVAVRWFMVVMRDESGRSLGVRDWLEFTIVSSLVVGAAVADTGTATANYIWPVLAATLVASLAMRLPSGKRLGPSAAAIAAAVAVAYGLYVAGSIEIRHVYGSAALMSGFAWALFMGYWNYEVALKLERARQAEADLAVAQERLRFASELHDIQGHHLQVIALKSELAARIGRDDSDAAVTQMNEVQQLALQAQRDSRAVVAGYRTVAVSTEINNAARVLEAAGVRTETRLPPGWQAAPEVEQLLGLLIRETTTNMLRHARPTAASFTLRAEHDHLRIEVSNDGGKTTSAPAGTGLKSLWERFAAAGGQLDWSIHNGVFTVTAQMPGGEART